jgi:uncharacterized membrane-anchored protein
VSPTVTRGLIALGALLVFSGVNYSMYAKERIRKEGQVVFLQLAPVDPRSLMQGDYMALRFAIASDLEAARRDKQNRYDVNQHSVGVRLDDRGVAQLVATDAPSGLRIRYRIREGRIWIGTNAYFFEEGTAERYSAARFGEFRLDRESGEAVLVGMRDEHLKAL